jgi:nucleoid-associated protein YgaU
MRRSLKPLLFSILIVSVAAALLFDRVNTRDAEAGVAGATPSLSSPEVSPPTTAPFDPDADTLVVVRIGGVHPLPRRESRPLDDAEYPLSETTRSRQEPAEPSRSPDSPAPDPSTVATEGSTREGPPSSARPGRSHVVQRGQTLSEISEERLGTATRWKEIADLNGITDPRKVRFGQILLLP